jgi:hypothetical protein
MLKPITSNVVSEVHAVVYVVLNKVDKRVLWEISWYQRMCDVINEVSH